MDFVRSILHEVKQLHRVSDRIDLLAEKHLPISEALGISGSVRNKVKGTSRAVVKDTPGRRHCSKNCAKPFSTSTLRESVE